MDHSNATDMILLQEPNQCLSWNCWLSQLFPSLRLIPALVCISAIVVIIRYLHKMRKNVVLHTHFQVYCIVLSVSDLISACSGVLTITGFVKFLNYKPFSILEPAILMFVGLNSINIHVLIALERLKSTTKLVPARNNTRTKMSSRRLVVYLVVSALLSLSLTVFPFVANHPRYVVGINDYYWTLDYGDSAVLAHLFVWVLITLEYVVPLAVICGAYVTIVQRLKRFRQGGVHTSMIRTNRVTALSAASAFAFVLGWTPFAVLMSLLYFGHEASVNYIFFANIVAKSSCVYNSLVFYASIKSNKHPGYDEIHKVQKSRQKQTSSGKQSSSGQGNAVVKSPRATNGSMTIFKPEFPLFLRFSSLKSLRKETLERQNVVVSSRV